MASQNQDGEHGKIGYFPDNNVSTQDKRPSSRGGHSFQSRQRRRRNKPLRISLVRLSLLLVCAAVFVFAAVKLISYGVDAIRSQNSSRQLQELYIGSSTTDISAMDIHTTNMPSADIHGTNDFATDAPTVNNISTDAAQATEALAQAVFTTAPYSDLTTQATYQKAAFYPGNERWVIRDSVQNVRRKNREVVGWLSIPNVLEEAVVQRDNSYYLTHDSLGDRNVTGAIFLDQNCLLRDVPEVFLLHGHNMKTGQMFGVLKHYKVSGSAYVREHSLITLETMFEKSLYAIFSVMEIETVYGKPKYFDFFSRFSFSSDEDFNAYVNTAKSYSMYTSSLDVKRGDRILTLATCTGGDESMRLLIMARRVRDDEDMIALQNAELSIREK